MYFARSADTTKKTNDGVSGPSIKSWKANLASVWSSISGATMRSIGAMTWTVNSGIAIRFITLALSMKIGFSPKISTSQLIGNGLKNRTTTYLETLVMSKLDNFSMSVGAEV